MHNVLHNVIVPSMPTRSQRPIVDRLLSVDPLKIHGQVYTSVDDLLGMMTTRRVFTAEELVAALADHGVVVSVKTVYRWKRDNQ